jgi:hypothetical protein
VLAREVWEVWDATEGEEVSWVRGGGLLPGMGMKPVSWSSTGRDVSVFALALFMVTGLDGLEREKGNYPSSHGLEFRPLQACKGDGLRMVS